jgi:hypothetical protein
VHSSILADGGAWAIGVMVLGPLVAAWLTLLQRRRSRRARRALADAADAQRPAHAVRPALDGHEVVR